MEKTREFWVLHGGGGAAGGKGGGNVSSPLL